MQEWTKELREEIKYVGTHLLALLKWACVAVCVGLGVGIVGVAFHKAVDWATAARVNQPWLLYLLPVAGLAIVGLYHLLGVQKDRGTNLVLKAVRGEDVMGFRVAPLIFIASVLTHLCGGSSGREGAALQLGGSICSAVGDRFHLSPSDRRILVMCGMAAAFSALFGTPLAAAVFALEVARIGVMYYSALVPALLSSLTAALLAGKMGLHPTAFTVAEVPVFSAVTLLQAVALGILTGLLAILFCQGMHTAHRLYDRLKNPYMIAALGGCIVVALTLLAGTRDYNGAGAEVIAAAVAGKAVPWAFLLKILFTALTLGAGFKGGEIVPTFFTGATFGCVVGPLLGLPASFGAAGGIVGAFCGVTNCPVSTILLAYELFGGAGLPLFSVIVAVSYLISGYSGLYSAQGMVWDKTSLEERDKEQA